MIQSISNMPTIQTKDLTQNLNTQSETKGFQDILKSAINQIDEKQKVSDQLTNELVNGNTDDLHNVMIAAQKASITLETGVQIQKKAIDAYNEVMRMQI
ncbi:MAG TPA: flagellar hook-basal body complex protein FliE [Candidatus Avamphibacillus intestinigallinarum]|nr:flagellar hook-basal body complex protein FliE [Candidatus Avamphibacillus intestinigallinarum]